MLDTGWIHTSTYIKVTYTLTLIPDGDIESRRWRYLKVISLGYKCIGTLCKISEGCLSSSSILVLSETSWSTLNIFFLYKRKALERSERREKNRDFNSWCGSFSLSLAMIDSRLRWVHIPVGCARRRQAAFYFYFNRKFPLIFVSSRAHLLVKSQKAWKSIFVYEKKTIHIEKMVDFFFRKKCSVFAHTRRCCCCFWIVSNTHIERVVLTNTHTTVECRKMFKYIYVLLHLI